MVALSRSQFVALPFALSLFSVAVTASPQFRDVHLHVLGVDKTDPVVASTISAARAAASSPATTANASNGAGSLQYASGGNVMLGAAAVLVYFVL